MKKYFILLLIVGFAAVNTVSVQWLPEPGDTKTQMEYRTG